MDNTAIAQRRARYLDIIRRRVRPGSGSLFFQRRTTILPIPDLQAVIRQTRFVIVGGVATRRYMPERATQDVDILVLANDAPLLYEELTRAGCLREGDLAVGESSWRLPDGWLLNVIVSDAVWVQDALQSHEYDATGLPVIALPYLVLMKLHYGRAQDIADITRMLGGADEDTLQDVRTVIATYAPDARDDLESMIELGKLELG